MSLTDKINNDIKEAMKAGQKDRLMALRDIKSKLLLEMTKGGTDGQVDDAAGMAILNKLLKQRMEAAEIYKSQNREDLLNEELMQAETIKSYLPAAMTADELNAELSKIIAEVGATSPADIGKVMGVATKRLAGKADGRAISEAAKSLLTKG